MALSATGRIVVAAGIATLSAASVMAAPLDALQGIFGDGANRGQAQLVQAQAPDSQYRIGQLEEQIRQLTGRIEELNFRLLQMQEQIRQTNEDNEFRFQALEGGAPVGGASSGDRTEAAPQTQSQAGTGAADASGGGNLPGTPPPVSPSTTGSTAPGADTAPPEQTLGTITFDSQGNLEQTVDSSTPGANAAGSDMAALNLDDPDVLYQDAYRRLMAGDYAVAEAAFRDYIDIHPDGAHVADANFWLGESQYSQGNFNDAARTFLNAHQTYPESEKAPEMLLKLGMSLAALENRDTACATYREVLSRYPDVSAGVREKVEREQRNASC